MKLTKADATSPEIVPLIEGQKEWTPPGTWQEYVYGGKERPETWVSKKTWKKVLSDHKYKCVRCRRHFPHGRGLSPHHVLPRAEGGNDDADNLIPLCIDTDGHKCHDYADMASLRSVVDIRLSFPTPDEDPCGNGLL